MTTQTNAQLNAVVTLLSPKAAGHFVCDEARIPAAADLALVTTGSGLAPFVSMLQTHHWKHVIPERAEKWGTVCEDYSQGGDACEVYGDNGAGLCASHQTGWTGDVATLIHLE